MQKITHLRHKIKKIDAVIMQKLAQRQKLAKKIGQLKKEKSAKITDIKREKTLMRYYQTLCMQYDLPFTYIKKIFILIIRYSRKLQK